VHISDGVLPLWLVAGAGVATAGLAAVTLPRLADADVPKTAVMAAAFFTASLLAFPVGGTGIHLSLTGLTGAMLGAAAFPAVSLSAWCCRRRSCCTGASPPSA
jgi:cobalt/nickel transport system permease protein